MDLTVPSDASAASAQDDVPLNSCLAQAQCLDLDVTRVGDTKQYEICLFYDNSLGACTKSSDTSTIGHACIGDDTGGYPETKIEDFAPGRENAFVKS